MALPPLWGSGEYFIPLRLLLLSRMIEREMARDLQLGFNLSVADWRVLALTCSNGSSSAAEIRAVFEADRAEVSRAVARLLKAGLIQREPDSTHRQKMRIMPTDAGRTIFDGVRPMREEYFASIMQDFGPGELEKFATAIRNIALRVDERRSARGSEGRHGEADPAAAGDDGDPDQE